MNLQHNGSLVIRQREFNSQEASKQRTIIVSGVARSGTAWLPACYLQAACSWVTKLTTWSSRIMPLPECSSTLVYDPQELDKLVEFRNADHSVWGFKRPHLHVHGVDTIKRFRNPLVILTVRDPVAIAERNAIAEITDPALGVSAAMQDLQDIIAFAKALTCPTLLISYEMALDQPDMCISRPVRLLQPRCAGASQANHAGLDRAGPPGLCHERPASFRRLHRQYPRNCPHGLGLAEGRPRARAHHTHARRYLGFRSHGKRDAVRLGRLRHRWWLPRFCHRSSWSRLRTAQPRRGQDWRPQLPPNQQWCDCFGAWRRR